LPDLDEALEIDLVFVGVDARKEGIRGKKIACREPELREGVFLHQNRIVHIGI
jgi:hypothetical protein